jgi:alkylation response protein AidB-like acyl-CoA dehydrogenase
VIDDGADPTGWWETMVGCTGRPLATTVRRPRPRLDGAGDLLEELGRAVDPSPYLATTTQFAGGAPLWRCGQAERWLSAVAAGSVTGALAFGAATVTATPTATGWRLDGTVADVVDGSRAAEIAVVATAPDGVGVFVVEVAAAGAALTAERIPAYDYTAHIATLRLDGVVVDADRRLAGTDVAAGVALATEEATLGWAVTTVGACQRILELTVDYVKYRHQLGVPIGSFHAVKHKPSTCTSMSSVPAPCVSTRRRRSSSTIRAAAPRSRWPRPPPATAS